MLQYYYKKEVFEKQYWNNWFSPSTDEGDWL